MQNYKGFYISHAGLVINRYYFAYPSNLLFLIPTVFPIVLPGDYQLQMQHSRFLINWLTYVNKYVL